MNKKLLLPLLALIFVTLITGGTDSADINRMIFVTAVGVDMDDTGYRYTFYTAVPTGADTAISENNVAYRAASFSAPSLAAAVRRLETGSARDISFEHLNCAAIGNSAINGDLSTMIDYLLREPAVRRQCLLFTLDGKAEDFFSSPFDGSIASGAASMLEQLDDSDNRSSIMTLGRLSGTLSSSGGYSLYVLGIDLPEQEISGTDASSPGSIALRGLAVYRSDGLGGVLSREDAELARLFTHGQVSGLITSTDTSGKDHYFEITYSDCRLSFQPGEPCRAFIDIKAKCTHIDSGGSSAIPPDDEQLSGELLAEMLRLAEISKNYGASITGLETEARQSHRLWYDSVKDRWDEIYKDTVIEISVDCGSRHRDQKS